MNVGVAYAAPSGQLWLELDLPDGSTVWDAIERSGVLARFPEIELQTQKIGVYGKLVKLDTPLKDGDRVEIYRPIICDPTQVKRRQHRSEDEL